MLRAHWLTRAACIGSLLATVACDPTRYLTLQGKKSLEGSTEPVATDADTTWGSIPGRTCADFYTNPPAPASGFDRVGFLHSFKGGPQPLVCQYRHNHVYRLAVRFDLSSMQRHVPRFFMKSARLSFDKRRSAGDHECADKLLVITSPDAAPGTPIRPTGEESYDAPVPLTTGLDCVNGRCSMEVRGQVSEWLRGTRENLGFVLRGEDERLNANDNASCTNEYANFRLDLDYTYEVVAPSRVPVIRPPLTPPTGSTPTLPALTLDVKQIDEQAGVVTYELRWAGTAPGVTNMNIHRGATIISTLNDQIEQDQTAKGTIIYKVCETGPFTRCSPTVTVKT